MVPSKRGGGKGPGSGTGNRFPVLDISESPTEQKTKNKYPIQIHHQTVLQKCAAENPPM